MNILIKIKNECVYFTKIRFFVSRAELKFISQTFKTHLWFWHCHKFADCW